MNLKSNINDNFSRYVIIFVFGAFVGWVMEVIYRSILSGQIVNPGFLSGPFLPIYGFGMLFLTILSRWSGKWYYKLTAFGILVLCLEIIGGWFFESYAHVRLWDYSGRWGNWNGWICPRFFLYWLGLASVYMFICAKVVWALSQKIATSWWKNTLVAIVFCAILLDAGHAFYGLEQVRLYVDRQTQKIPLLDKYKVWRAERASSGFGEIWSSLRNYTNYRLSEKISR